MKTRVAVGIDPGARNTGVVLRVDGKLCGAWDCERLTEPMVPTQSQMLEILDTIDMAASRGMELTGGSKPVIAIEDLVPHESNPSMRRKTTAPLVSTGAIIAVVLMAYPSAVRVPPGENGSECFVAYPEQLRPKTGKGKGQDALRHCRSAWDVAVAGERLAQHGVAAS